MSIIDQVKLAPLMKKIDKATPKLFRNIFAALFKKMVPKATKEAGFNDIIAPLKWDFLLFNFLYLFAVANNLKKLNILLACKEQIN